LYQDGLFKIQGCSMNTFELLQDLLLGQTHELKINDFKSPFEKRFFKAWQNNFNGRSLLDIAILFREILLHENSKRTNGTAILLLNNQDGWPDKNTFERVGVTYNFDGQYIRLSAVPWIPNWLGRGKKYTIETDTISMFNIRSHTNFKRNEKDLFLKQFGLFTYNSLEQKKAVRSALSLEAGETLAISLPTGEGKSLVFQLISQVGFFNSYASGVTIVVVPTVALALDHEKSMQRLLETEEVFAFLSEDEKKKEDFKRKIKDGSQSIIFTSPEAVYTSLRNSLIEAAKSGYIRAIVVDEAHIIDEWGNDFRHEFQVFSGLWRQLLRLSPHGNKFRTIMLSATYTQEAIDLIQNLFTEDKHSLNFYNAAKLRPEIDYWVSPMTDKELQQIHLLEALHYLPRPLIVYTSTQQDAKKYYEIIKMGGFESVGLLYGGSSTNSRNEVVSKWKNENLDIVVGTSAFGMGIDYAHVRSVIHVCIAETMNRFYQEVGRGGRDGAYSLSLVLPTKQDEEIAKTINTTKIIGNEKGFSRWEAMFKAKQIDDQSDCYIIDIGAPPQYDRDLESDRHYRWNFQVLTLMARAGMIQLEGVPHKEPYWEEPERYILISIQKENHLDKKEWYSAITPIRNKIYKANQKSLKLMYDFLKEEKCPADILGELYSIEVLDKTYNVAKSCSHCNLCRDDERLYQNLPVVGSLNKKDLKESASLLIEYENEYSERSFKRKFPKVIESLLKQGYQSFVFIGDAAENFLEQQEKVKVLFEKRALFIETISTLSQMVAIKPKLPQNNLIILIGNNIVLTPGFIEHNVKGNLIIVPKGIRDPRRSSPRLADIFQGDVIRMSEFMRRI